jgi:peptidyl-prolyl cis-trans isomerase D
MLQQMRKFSKSWFSTLLMGGLALSFVLWGIGDIFRGRTSTDVATIGSTEIDQAQFQREYRATIRVLGQRTGKDVTQEEAHRAGIPRQTLDRMMSDAALYNYASSFGINVSDERVTQQIQTTQGFQGVLGTFDHETFLRAINSLGYSEAEFINLMRRDLSTSQLRSAVEDGFVAPTGYVVALLDYLTEARAAEYIVLTPAMLGPIAPPSDKALASYVAAHPERFSTPEYRSVTYAAIGPEDIADKITITDKQLHDAYDQHKADYVVPEKRDADQISFPTEAEAKAARAKLDTGLTYDALAAQRKLSAQTISMGSVAKEQIVDKAQADAIFSLPEGGISQPVKGPFGYILFRVRKITPGVNKSFDDAKADLEKQLKTELAASMLVDIVNKFTDAQGSGDDIAQAGKTAGMRVIKVAEVDAKGFDANGAKVDVPAGDFLKAVFTADTGTDGDAFQTADGHWYAVRVNGSTPPKLKPLDAVRADAVASWTAEQQTKALAQKAEAMAAEANRDHKLTGAVQTSGRLTRDTKNDIFSGKLVTALFATPAGVAVTGPLGKGEGYVVARTTGVAHEKVTPGSPGYQQVGRALSSQIASDVSESLANAEKTRQGSTVNQKLLDSTVGNETT